MTISRDENILNKIGFISSKISNESKNPKAPKGDFLIDGVNYTCWDQPRWDKFNEGDEVDFEFKESEWNGQKKRNLINMFSKQAESMKVNKEVIDGGETEVVKDEISSNTKIETKTMGATVDSKSNDSHPNEEDYYLVMKGKKYKLIPTGDYLVGGEWKKAICKE